MIVNVKKCNGDEIQYVSDLGLLDLTSMMGYLFATGVIEDWSVDEYEPEDIIRSRNERLYKLEKKFVKNGKVFSDAFITNNM